MISRTIAVRPRKPTANTIPAPQWFVSHWWGEAVFKFIACAQAHATLRHFPSSVAYWVCAYANNQWLLDVAITKGPNETSFRKAMGLSTGVLCS